MPTPNKDVAAAPLTLSLFWQNIFVWLAGFLVFLTLVQMFEYSPRPAEIWATLVEMSAALVMVLGMLSAIIWGVDWLADRFSGNWRVAARILNADIVWLGCFLLAIFHPGSQRTAVSATEHESVTVAKP